MPTSATESYANRFQKPLTDVPWLLDSPSPARLTQVAIVGGTPEHCVLSGAVSQSADHSAPDARAWEAGRGVCHVALPAALGARQAGA